MESLPSPAARVALRIARCKELDRARDQLGHPCHQIVALQPDPRIAPDRFQVPEAWAGKIETGRLVFVSSNPSISEDGVSYAANSPEDYPRHSWDDRRISDFISRRFDPEARWAQDDKFMRQDGTYAAKKVAFWSRARKRAGELIDEAVPERDYAMAEVVHCKSHHEKGVKSAAPLCFLLYFEEVMRLSVAPLVVVVGAKARDLLTQRLALGTGFGSMNTVSADEEENIAARHLGGRERVVLYLGHLTGMSPNNTFALRYPKRLEELRALARGELSVDAFSATLPASKRDCPDTP
ncbi:MAG TPA: hypothetical protein VFN61_01425 [Acidimicrobiales bacterium]|nr:hypothetical protein [Acidimicrobiales bacterium]